MDAELIEKVARAMHDGVATEVQADIPGMVAVPFPLAHYRALAVAAIAALSATPQADRAKLSNPYTGDPRDYRDVESDPSGVLIREPGAPLRAATPQAATSQADRRAIKLLVAAGFVTEEKANEALNIAHGFQPGPLAATPQAAQVQEAKPVPAASSTFPVYEGDWFIPLRAGTTRVCSATYAKGWNECRAAMLAAQPQAAQVPVAVVREYVEARFALEVAQSPPVFGGRPRRLRHNDERMVRVRRALGELEAAARGQAAQVTEGYALVDKEAAKALVAGPFMHHHKMNELQEREAKGFDRCRELTLEKIDTFFAAAQAQGVGRD